MVNQIHTYMQQAKAAKCRDLQRARNLAFKLNCSPTNYYAID
jgi:hypothetical protein